MSLLLITARTNVSVGSPSASAIKDALVASRLAGSEANRGNWIGPGPRITRVISDDAGIDEHTITVAWLYGWPTGGPYTLTTPPMQAIAAELVAAVATNLNGGTRTSWEVSSAPYAPAFNGDVAFWQSGAAANTTTKDAPSEGVTESPYGPAAGTGGATGGTGGITPNGGNGTPPSPSQGTPPAQGMSSTAKWGIGLGLAAAVGYGVWSMNKSSSGKRRG